jgi:hypothetical protein
LRYFSATVLGTPDGEKKRAQRELRNENAKWEIGLKIDT